MREELTKERFYQIVTANEVYKHGYWQAYLRYNGKDYMADGFSEQEAKDGLWEYLTSDIGII